MPRLPFPILPACRPELPRTCAPARSQDIAVYRGAQVSPEVERIYERGLSFLAAAQTEDGGFPGNYGAEPATA